MDLALFISIFSFVLVILNFFFGRKDKSVKDTGDSRYKMGIIDEKLANISKQIEKLSEKLDTFDNEIDMRIEKAIEAHERAFHLKS